MRPMGLAALLLLSSGAIAAGDGTEAVCRGGDGFAQSFEGRRTFLWRPDQLQSSKSLVATGALRAAQAELFAAANRALQAEPYTVTDKPTPAASGDPHDYTSLGPYWWPDPDRPDGLPYVRKDGTFNPERDSEAYDLTRLEHMSRDVRSLALAYYFSDEQRYAAKGAALVRAWFLDPRTRMNPNLAHGQSIPGRVAGRAEGVIDAHRLPRVIESIGLLGPSGEISDDEQKALQAWFGELVNWMATSAIGRAEREKHNNHGIYYDSLISHFALFAGLEDVAARTIRRSGARRLRPQIGSNGGMPAELARSRSLHYTTWTLMAAMDLADLGRCVGTDMWSYPKADRPIIRTAVDFVVPYVGREQAWPWPELDKTQHAGTYEVLMRAGVAWNEPRYIDLARSYSGTYASLPINLVFPMFPNP